MRKSIFRFVLLLSIQNLWSHSSFAQNVIRCGTEQYLQLQEEKFPGTIQKLKELQQAAQQWAADHPDALRHDSLVFLCSPRGSAVGCEFWKVRTDDDQHEVSSGIQTHHPFSIDPKLISLHAIFVGNR